MAPELALPRRRAWAPRLIAAILSVSSWAALASPVTLDATHSLRVAFTTVATNADMLVLFGLEPVAQTGAPQVTYQLFDGDTLLGSAMGLYDDNYLQVMFESENSLYSFYREPNARVPFSAIQAGGMDGEVLVTVTGGSITFDLDDLHFYTARLTADEVFVPLGDLRLGEISVVNAVPEPSSIALLGIAVAGVAASRRRQPA